MMPDSFANKEYCSLLDCVVSQTDWASKNVIWSASYVTFRVGFLCVYSPPSKKTLGFFRCLPGCL